MLEQSTSCLVIVSLEVTRLFEILKMFCCDGRDGTDGRSTKVSFNFLHTFWAFRTCIYIYILKYHCLRPIAKNENMGGSWFFPDHNHGITRFHDPKIEYHDFCQIIITRSPIFRDHNHGIMRFMSIAHKISMIYKPWLWSVLYGLLPKIKS